MGQQATLLFILEQIVFLWKRLADSAILNTSSCLAPCAFSELWAELDLDEVQGVPTENGKCYTEKR